MIILEKNYLVLEVDKNHDCLIQHWKGFATSEQFRDGVLKALDAIKQHRVARMISDTKNQAIVKKEESDFAASLVPEFIKNGMKSFAFVVPSSVFTQLALDKFKKESTSFPIQYFDDLDKAKEWISRT